MWRLKNNIALFLCTTILLLFANPYFGQNKKDLERKKKKLQKEIQLTNKLLKETRKDKDLSVDELLKLKSKINSRSNLIAAMNSEMKLINTEIGNSKQNISDLETELILLKSECSPSEDLADRTRVAAKIDGLRSRH